jgi:hypothetical protein
VTKESKIKAPGLQGPEWHYPNECVGLVMPNPDGRYWLWGVIAPWFDDGWVASGKAGSEIVGWLECNTAAEGITR